MTGEVDLNVNALPTLSNVALATVCQGATTTSLTYTGATGGPGEYTLDYNAAAQLAGLVDIVNAPFGASPVTVPIPAGVPAGSYNAVLTVRNTTTTCASVGIPVVLNIAANPVFAITSNAQVRRNLYYTG